MCEELNEQKVKAKNRAELEDWKSARENHREYVAKRRRLVLDDEHRARTNPESFAMIYIDGADQNTTYVPQHWRKHLRLEMDNNSYIKQRIMSVLIIGPTDRLVFYVCTPLVSMHHDTVCTNSLLTCFDLVFNRLVEG